MGGISSIITAAAPVFKAVTPLLGALGGSKPSAPAPQAAPAAPAVAAAPEAPKVSEAKDVSGTEPVVDAEAAKVRASKRRKAAEDARLFNLAGQDDDAVIKSKSLLGE